MASILSAGTTSATAMVHTADTSGVLQLASNNGTVALTIDTSQNVGIGTSSPTEKLHVVGTAANILLNRSSYAPKVTMQKDGTEVTSIQGISGGGLLFSYGSSTTEAMRIDSSGNVGIGVTPKTYASGKALEVGFAANGLNGSQQAQLNVNCNLYYDGSWRYGGTGKGTLIQLTDGTVNIYTTTSSGTAGSTATLTTGPYVANGGTSWTNSSDEQLKNITGEIENALDKVGQLRAAQFTWKSDASNKPQVGLIAQDLQAVLPEVVVVPEKEVTDQGEQQYLGVNYDQVIPLLVASIKELKAINDQQAQTITALTARIVALEEK